MAYAHGYAYLYINGLSIDIQVPMDIYKWLMDVHGWSLTSIDNMCTSMDSPGTPMDIHGRCRRRRDRGVCGWFWGNLGELWGKSKVIFNKIPEDCVNLCFAFLGRTRIDPGVIRDHFQPCCEFSGTPTCHAGAVWAAWNAHPLLKGVYHLAAIRCHLVTVCHMQL